MPDADEMLTRILDAAAEEFSRHGVRRTSMDDVARRAKVGRNTVFRRLGSKDELVHAVLGREMVRLFGDLERVVADVTGPLERLVSIFATTVRALRAHPMQTDEALSAEAAELSGFGGGEFIRLSADFVAGVLAADRERGELSDTVDIPTIAELTVRLVHSVVLVPHLHQPLDSDADLRAFAAAALGPHLR
ncbi:MAG TPA: helix-turn-helix domain-containing protein [Sporichthyaceae bacterium]|jgi:AcrR family transcriptional regulator